jgi:hypothetical protein
MRDLADPEYIARLIKASGVANPKVVVIDQGFFFYADSRVFVDNTPHPTMRVTVDPPKTVPAKKPKRGAAPRPKRLKNPAIGKDGVILLKDKEQSSKGRTSEP